MGYIVEGVLFQAGGVVAFTILIFLIFGITFIAGCCCGTKARRKGCTICGKVGYIFSVLLLCGGLGASMWYTENFHSGLLTLLRGLQNFYNLFTSSSTLVSGSLIPSLSDFSSSATTLQSFGTGSPYQAQTDALGIASVAALSFVTNIGTLLNSTTNAMTNDFSFSDSINSGSSSKVDLQTASDALPRSTYILMGVIIGWLVIQMILLIGNKCISRIFKSCSILTLGSAVLIGLLAALFYIPSLMGSDICINPNSAISNIFNTTSDGDSSTSTFDVANTWLYYAECSSITNLAPSGVYSQLLNSSDQLTTAYTLIQNINTSVYGNPTYDPWIPYIMNISTSILMANSTLTTLINDVSCAPVSTIYSDIVDGLCNGAIVGMITAFLATICTLGVFLLILSFTACLIFHHPGDYLGDGDSNSSTYEKLYQELNGNKSNKNYGSYEASPTPATGRAARVGANMGGSAASYANSNNNSNKKGKDWR